MVFSFFECSESAKCYIWALPNRTMKHLYLFLLSCLLPYVAEGQWTTLETGINDEFTGVVFSGNTGYVSGHNGIYRTTTGGASPADWAPLVPSGTPADLTIYANTEIRSMCFSTNSSSGRFFCAGRDKTTDKPVLLHYEGATNTLSVLYYGAENGALNSVAPAGYNQCVAVGTGGLAIRYVWGSGNLTNVNINTTDDLTSVNCDSYDFAITGGGKVYFGYNTNVTFETEAPGVVTACPGYPETGYSFGQNYIRYNEAGASVNNNFYAPLNPRNVLLLNQRHYLATDHGVYLSNTGRTFLEWQVGSGTDPINAINYDFSTLYACGPNGLLLKGLLFGGNLTEPYAGIDIQPNCFEYATALTASYGTVSSVLWRVDGANVTTNFGPWNYWFSSTGNHLIELTVTNSSGLSRTISQTVTVVNQPQIDLPVAISDDLLCNSESITITIQNPEPNVTYSLRSAAGGHFGGASGSGAELVFESGQISEAGNYYITAKNAFGSCVRNFSEVFAIDIEHTQAEFSAGLINALAGETIPLYENTTDAQHHEWTLVQGQNSTTTLAENTEATFSETGPTEITLHAWSDNGCHDTKTKPGPYIYDPLLASGSWVLNHPGTDIYNGQFYGNTSPYHNTPTLMEAFPVTGGYLICGQYVETDFQSRAGNHFDLTEGFGGYLAKHDNEGVLRWVVYTQKAVTTERDIIYASVEDSQGNIYLCTVSEGMFYDTTGRGINLNPSPGTNLRGVIIKLDPNGKLIWYLQAKNGFYPKRMYIDHSDHIIVQGEGNNSSWPADQQVFYLNGEPTTQSFHQENAGWPILLKISPDAQLIWKTSLNLVSINSQALHKIAFDDQNNFYVSGYFEQQCVLNSTDGTSVSVAPYDNLGADMFLAKYSADGIVQWATRAYTTTALEYGRSTYIHDLKVSDAGDIFLCGYNDIGSGGTDMIFESVSGAQTVSQNRMFIFKINTDGEVQWTRGIYMTPWPLHPGGNLLNLENDRLDWLGQMGSYQSSIGTGTFDGTDIAEGYTLNLDSSDYYWASYDLEGNLQNLWVSGENTDWFTNNTLMSFFKGPGSAYYLGANLYNQYSGKTLFGADVPVTNQEDAVVARFDESTALLRYARNMSITDSEKAKAVIFPNPTDGVYTIQTSGTGKGELFIYDISGKLLERETVEDVSQISREISYPSGVYYAKVRAAGATFSVKIVKAP